MCYKIKYLGKIKRVYLSPFLNHPQPPSLVRRGRKVVSFPLSFIVLLLIKEGLGVIVKITSHNRAS
jgi:hypothetical protein